MSQENSLKEAVRFLLNEHLQGEPNGDTAIARFTAAKAHLEALVDPAVVAEETKVEVPKVVPQIPSVVKTEPVNG